MLKPLIAGITALSLNLAIAVPAQANGFDREDAGRLLIGLAAIAALSAAIDNNNRNERREERSTQTQHRNNSWADLNRPRERERAGNRDLPRQCLRNIETRFGTHRMFTQRCLERNYAHVNRLPKRCAVRVYSDNGPRRGFDPLCLREAGYRATRRH